MITVLLVDDHVSVRRGLRSMLEATENEALAEIRRRTQQDRERFMAATGH